MPKYPYQEPYEKLSNGDYALKPLTNMHPGTDILGLKARGFPMQRNRPPNQ